MTTPRPFLNVPYGAYLSREVPAPDEELTRVAQGAQMLEDSAISARGM